MGTRHIVIALGAVLLLGGCATNGSGTIPQPGDSMSSSDESPSPSPFPSGMSLPPTEASKPAGGMTLTGQVEAGVEHGCLIMKTGGVTYLLVGGDPAVVKAGAQVVVTGRLAPGLKSYCMQGSPFQVSDAH